MGLNKQSGNMYPWVDYTWNPIRGKCPHECVYCYMKVFPQKEMAFHEKALQDKFPCEKSIFVGSSFDIFAEAVPSEWIAETIRKCRNNENHYYFQTKNPKRIMEFYSCFPLDTTLGFTIETNREYTFSKAPTIQDRFEWIEELTEDYPIFISIEPIMDFDLRKLIDSTTRINPVFVSLGADSKGHNLPEPHKEKVMTLITSLKELTEVKIKENLNRIIKCHDAKAMLQMP